MQDLSRSELEAILKAIDPSGLPKKEELKGLTALQEESTLLEPNLSRVQLAQIQENRALDNALTSNENLNTIQFKLDIVLGRSHVSLAELLELKGGNTLKLDKLAGEPVDIELNGRIIAQGEVVVINDTYGIQITQIKN